MQHDVIVFHRKEMADVEEATRFSVSFYMVNVIFKRFQVNSCENARILINHVLIQC